MLVEAKRNDIDVDVTGRARCAVLIIISLPLGDFRRLRNPSLLDTNANVKPACKYMWTRMTFLSGFAAACSSAGVVRITAGARGRTPSNDVLPCKHIWKFY